MSTTKDQILEKIYTVNAKSVEDAVDYLMGDFPIIEKNLSLVDEVLNDLDLNILNSQMLYQLVAMTSAYINVLKNYRSFYTRVVNEASQRGYSDKRIEGLFGSYEHGGNHLYDPNYVQRKSYDDNLLENLDQKITWAQEIQDDVLKGLLENYKFHMERAEHQRHKYREAQHAFGNVEYNKVVAKALRAMADKVEEKGSHFIIDADLPRLPIYGKDYDEFEIASITVTLAPYPMGG